MSLVIPEIVLLIRESHFPNERAERSEVSQREFELQMTLTDDMREFYGYCNGASLFRPPHGFPPIRIMSLGELCPARIAIRGLDVVEAGPAAHIAFIDRGDGDYLAIDLSSLPTRGNVIDCWHEAYPDPLYCPTVFGSFTDCIRAALRGKGSSIFW
jgi:hypothetical protein